jgi:hypothetical protein
MERSSKWRCVRLDLSEFRSFPTSALTSCCNLGESSAFTTFTSRTRFPPVTVTSYDTVIFIQQLVGLLLVFGGLLAPCKLHVGGPVLPDE